MKKPRGPKSVKKAKSTAASPKDDGAKTSPDASPETEPATLTELQDLEALASDATVIDQTPADPLAGGVPETEELPPDNLPEEDRPLDDHPQVHHPQDEEHGSRTLAATALMILVGVLFIASLTLWAAPKVAPHLPAGVAKYLIPGQMDTADRLASLGDTLAAETAKNDDAIAALRTKVAALSGQMAADTKIRQAEISAVQSAAETTATDAAALSARLDAVTTEITALRGEFSAVSTALTDAGTGETAASPEFAAAVAALGARLDSLAAQGLEARIAALETRLEAIEASTADARDVQSEVLGEASSAIRQARLQAAFDLLTSRLTGGYPYADKLDEIAALSGTEPPATLTTKANAGLASATALEASFSRYAQTAIAADVKANAGDGRGLQALGWLRAQVASRPTTEQEGDSAGAITSRIAARVGEGKLAEALAEAVTLPEHSQTALEPWLGQLRDRVDSDIALIDWRIKIGVDG